MDSSLAHQDRRSLIDAARRMKPAERLKSYFEHSRLIIKLQEAGKHFRQLSRQAIAISGRSLDRRLLDKLTVRYGASTVKLLKTLI